MPLQNAEYYDKLHANSLRSFEHYSHSKYYEMYVRIALECFRGNWLSVCDIGCGTGTLGQYLTDMGFKYFGFDISEVAVSIALQKRLDVVWADIETSPLRIGYDCFICTEVLEHLEDELVLLRRLPVNARFIFSVPDFMDESHVRCFKTEKDIRKRYGELLNIESVWKFPRRHLVSSRVK